jgi:UDP-N-acetylmuramyl pentapeptide phosphotransferase/UDP-N-acetylglucosamine-1-phosphate transferase
MQEFRLTGCGNSEVEDAVVGDGMTVAAPALYAFAVTVVACPLVLRAIRHRLLDEPNDRSLHDTATPRGGGVAVVLGALVAVSFTPGLSEWRAPLALAAAGFGVLGLLDDLRHLPALTRLALQVLMAVVVAPRLLVGLTGPLAWKAVFIAGVLLWLVSFVNAFNFMDGINGVSALQAVVVGLAWWVVGRAEDVPALAGPGLVIAASAAAFVPFNFPRARMFLGDVGSYFIGGWLAVLVVVGLREGVPVEAVVAPLAIALADTLSTVIRRVRRGETWYEAHAEHVYQRLVHAGWSHTSTTVFVGAAVALCCVLGVTTMALETWPSRLVADAGLAGILAGYLASPNLLARSGGPPAGAGGIAPRRPATAPAGLAPRPPGVRSRRRSRRFRRPTRTRAANPVPRYGRG